MSLTTLLVVLSLASAGACAALAFTRWGQRRPLHRYGALSIAAHLLLLAGLASVRTGGPPQGGAEDAPPVRVRIVMQTTTPPEPEPEAEPTAAQPSEAEPIEAEALAVAANAAAPETPTPATVDNPDQAWSGLPEPVAVAQPEDAPTPTEVAAETPAPVEALAEADPAAATEPPTPENIDNPDQAWSGLPEPVAVAPLEDAPSPSAPPAEARSTPPTVAVSPLAPAAYHQRGELQQRRLSADQGGTQETLDAVASAVDWLARAQRRDGAWDAARWGGGRETKVLGHDRRGAGGRAETGLTGLALLALGGAGHTHTAGPYQDTVVGGLQFLLDQQRDNGDLAGDASLYARTYCHSMATFALAEAMAVTGDERLQPAVEAAVDYLVRGRNVAGGGWRYQAGDRGDMSQMGWAVMALRSAELAGVRVPETVWDGCERFVASVRRGEDGGLAAYQPRGPVSNTMTAEAMYCRQILGVADRRANAEAMRALANAPPGRRSSAAGRRRTNLYYLYYATLALHHHRSKDAVAEQTWRRWNDAMQRTILPQQVAQGRDTGSWGADTVWGSYGGRVYSTALATMCLEVYYRYDPDKIGRDPWIAARGGTLTR